MPFEIFLVNHSHIDVGYTERQEKIAQYQADFIAQAVQFANSPAQAGRKSDSKFKFTCEGFWPVERYLEKYGSRGEEELVKAVKAGFIELSGFYLHMSELLDQGHIEKSIARAYDFAQKHHLLLDSAMASDINGFSWGVSEALADKGVKYLISNINSHHGGAPLDGPNKPFRWLTPSGQKLLVWSGLPYHKANLLGLMAGLSPSSNPGVPGMKIFDTYGYLDLKDTFLAEKRIPELLEGLRQSGYPYDFLPVMGSGVYTDNSPVGDGYCDIVRQWNEKFGQEVHIQTATVSEFFAHLEKNLKDIPQYRGEWTDWWTDGAISMPTAVKTFRLAQRTKRLIELMDADQKIVNAEKRTQIESDLFLFSEHTFGHSASLARPWDFFVQRVDARKRIYAYRADIETASAMDDVMTAYGEGTFRCARPFAYKVLNPLNTAKKSVALFPLDFWELDLFKQGLTVTDESGRQYGYQMTNTLRGRMVAVVLELAPKEARSFIIRPAETVKEAQPVTADIQSFENDFYQISWSESGFTSWFDKNTGSEILNSSDGALGAPVYQIFPKGKRGDAAGFSYSARKMPQFEIYHGEPAGIKVVEQGPILTTVMMNYTIQGARDYRVILSMYQDLPLVEMTVEFTKELILDPEGMYIALPFAMPDGKWLLDKPGAVIEPGKDQIPGSCCDYYAVSKGFILQSDAQNVAISSYDTPMVTIGGLKLWQYNKTIDPSGLLYSWVTNNKWETNFSAECGGCYQFRYTIETGTCDGSAMLDKNEHAFVVLRK